MGNCTCCTSANSKNKVAALDEEAKKEANLPKKCLDGHLLVFHEICPEEFEDRKIPCQTCKKKITVDNGFYECTF